MRFETRQTSAQPTGWSSISATGIRTIVRGRTVAHESVTLAAIVAFLV
jgi:hypothetical protein